MDSTISTFTLRNDPKIILHSDFTIFRYTLLKSLVLDPLKPRFSPRLSKIYFVIVGKFIFSSFLNALYVKLLQNKKLKHKAAFCFLLLLNCSLIAQPAIEWKKNYGGSADDIALSIQQTTDGGYIVAGYSFSNDGDAGGNNGNMDYWIVKLDELGNLQ